MASLYDANTNYQINGVDLRDNPGLVTREYLIDVYPSLIDNFIFAGLWGWGNNGSGQLGTNDLVHRSSPVQTIAGGTNWKQVSSGYYTGLADSGTSAAIKTDGTLWLWGNNGGRLGTNEVTARSSPVQTVAGGTNWKQVDVRGQDHTVAIKTDGTLWVWGGGITGELGTNNIIAKSSPTQVGADTNWKQISVAERNTAAIKTDGTLWLWGGNSVGQLGNNEFGVNKSSPVQTIAGGTNWKQVSLGLSVTAAIKTDGTLWTWGVSTSGQLGINDTISKSSPTQVGADTNWKQVSAGNGHTAAIKTDGTLWVWGSNLNGQLSTNDTANRSSPVQTIAGGTNWKQVAAGSLYTAAIKTDGTLWVWGRNDVGQLGLNDTASRSSPVQTVAGGTNWKQVSVGLRDRMYAIRDDSSDPFRSEPL